MSIVDHMAKLIETARSAVRSLPRISISTEELHSLLAALLRAEAQNTELQQSASDLVNAQRARRVRAFHVKFGHPVRTTPEVPSDGEVRFRLKLITEEFFELLESSFDFDKGDDHAKYQFARCVDSLNEMIQNDALKVDLPALMDACEDLDYVVEGTRAAFGVDGSTLATAVHEANMAKTATQVAAKDAHHLSPTTIKPTKPEGWKPPDIAGQLKAQGWRP